MHAEHKRSLPWWLKLVLLLILGMPGFTGWPNTWMVQELQAMGLLTPQIAHVVVWVAYAGLVWLVVLVVAGKHKLLNYLGAAFVLALTVAMSFALSSPFNRHSHEIYEFFQGFLQRWETDRHHPDDEPVSLGHSHVVILGMGRVGTGAYDEFTSLGHRTVGLDSDPGKAELHRKAGRRVLYADAEDPGFWSHLDLGSVEQVVLTMPELEAKLIATRQLRKRGFTGKISATVLFTEEVDSLRRAGADQVYDYHDGIGVGLAHLALELRS